MKSVKISEMQYSEIDACAEVIRKSFSTVADEFGLTKENCATNGAFMENNRLVAEKQAGKFMVILSLDSSIIGFAALANNGDSSFELEKLAVLPQYRHCGYGKMLLDFAKEKVSAWSGSKITIGIIEENTRLKDWYTQYGFLHTGTKKFPHLPFTVGFMELAVNRPG